MARVCMMFFQEPRRDRCSICRRCLALSCLVLLRRGERVAGEMALCAGCARLFGEVCPGAADPEEMPEGEEAGL